MILAFTDFGYSGPYLGEMRTAALREAPTLPYVDLLADAPALRPDLAAYLLAALAARLQPGDVVLGVVDPGVGTERAPLAVAVDDCWLVGPDNGLFELTMRRAGVVQAYRITWQPPAMSASFHGRDLFAPVAARLASGDRLGLTPTSASREPDWPDDLDRIVHVDHYGNLISGRRAQTLQETATLQLKGHDVHHARTFAAAPAGAPFWYANSGGLVEIATNGGSAAKAFGVDVDAPVEVKTFAG
jgi:S-adenosylmethionine hydrolase